MDPPSRPNQPLTYDELKNIDERAFNDLQNIPSSKEGSSFLPKSSPGTIAWWCSLDKEPDMTKWNPEINSGTFKDLSIFKVIDQIINNSSKNHVTIVMAPTGVGKSLMGPMLHAQMLKKMGPYKARIKRTDNDVMERKEEAKEYVSWRGLTICPSSEQAQNTSKMCQKIFMNSRESFSEIVSYINPYEQMESSLDKESLESISRDVPSPPQFAITNFRGGLMALACRDFFLKLVILDDAHSTKPEIVLTLVLARRLLHWKQLEKLVLTSATLDSKEIEELRSFFEEKGLTLKVVDLNKQLGTVDKLQMSCARLKSGKSTGEFVETPLSARLTKDFNLGNVPWPMNPNRNPDGTIVWTRERPKPFGYEEHQTIPEMNDMMPYVKQAVHRVMELATHKLERRDHGDKMSSMLIIVPGNEHAERLRSSIENVIEPTPGSDPYERNLGLYKSVMYKDTGKTAFFLERVKPSPAARGIKETPEEIKKREEKRDAEMVGPWGGKKGVIYIATPNATEGMTLDDIAFVIDAGVHRIPSEYCTSGLKHLDLRWIDKRLLKQRAGRCGRKMKGEYFLCVSGHKVDRILRDDRLRDTMLLRNFDDMTYYLSKKLKVFDELIWAPHKFWMEEFRRSFNNRGLWDEDEGRFTMKANLLHLYFPFLRQEQARMVVMGVRLGLAAHVICYVAESIVTHTLCGRPTKIAENYEAIGESAAYETYVNVNARSEFRRRRASGEVVQEQIRPYDMGDSVAMADLITTWLRHFFPRESEEHEPNFDKYVGDDNAKWDAMERRAALSPDGVFWSGRWCMGKDEEKGGAGKDNCIGMKKIQDVMIRNEGREAVCVAIHQITRACQRLEIIFAKDSSNPEEGRGSILSPRFNRYLIAEDNYNLSKNGRALFRAILTMNSDKLAHAWEVRYTDKIGDKFSKWDRFEIYEPAKCASNGLKFIFPHREDWRERNNKGTASFVRYWQGFKPTHGPYYTGCVDPLTTKQAAFFLNVFGKSREDANGILINLNAVPMGHKEGLFIRMDLDVMERVKIMRKALNTVTDQLLMEKKLTFNRSAVAQAIIDFWKGLDSDVESKIEMLEKWEKKANFLDLIHGRIGYMKYSDGLSW